MRPNLKYRFLLDYFQMELGAHTWWFCRGHSLVDWRIMSFELLRKVCQRILLGGAQETVILRKKTEEI